MTTAATVSHNVANTIITVSADRKKYLADTFYTVSKSTTYTP